MNTLRRREFLLAGAGTLLAGASRATPSDADPATTWRWLNRLSWGADDAMLAQALAQGREAWLRAQLAPSLPAPLPAPVQAHIDALDIQRQPLAERRREVNTLRRQARDAATDADRTAARQAYQRALQTLARQTAQRQVLRALHSTAQLHELMGAFWFNHFNLHQGKAQVRLWLADYEDQALRPHALGSFRALLGAATRHPAMLQYLDNAQNAAQRLNENHARELLELHTLGVDGGYGQRDVQELARVLTGHGLALPRRGGGGDEDEDGYAFQRARHDFGDKQLLGHRLRGRGEAELDEVLDLLVAHPSTARFIAGKIARFMLGEAPPTALVAEMADTFARTGGQIAPVLRVLALSPAVDQAPPQFKTPQQLVLGAIRLAGADPAAAETQAQRVPLWLAALGQGLYQRVTPDGYPLQPEAWNSAGQMAQRLDAARAIGAGRARGSAPPALAQGRAVQQVLLPALRPASRQALQAAGSTAEWNALLLASPEYQYR